MKLMQENVKSRTPLVKANEALRQGNYAQAIAHYAQVIVQQPELAKSISANLTIARNKYRASRQVSAKPSVAVCGWDLAHNAAGRVYTLATIYETFAQVEIIGSLFLCFGREIWEPIRDTQIAKYTFVVEDESKFIEQAIQLIAAHPYDIVHLSKPRAPNIFFGILYKLLWGAKVLMDIDDEELAFVGAETPISIDDYIQQHGNLPELNNLAGKDWTRLAVGLAKEFDGLTVCNAALQQRYGGEIIRHARNEKFFKPSPELKRQSREKYGIPQDAKVVLFFGTPREHKGLIETAQVIASLKRPDVIYCIVGSFSDESLKQRLLEVKGCNYKFLPNQSISKTSEILATADCCVLLQDTNSTAAQFQTPAKLSDALAMGLRVLTNSTDDLKEYCDAGMVEKVDVKNLGPKLALTLEHCDAPNSKAVALFRNKFSLVQNSVKLKHFEMVCTSTLIPRWYKNLLSGVEAHNHYVDAVYCLTCPAEFVGKGARAKAVNQGISNTLKTDSDTSTQSIDSAESNREIKNYSIQNHQELKTVILERGYFDPTTYRLANIDVTLNKVDPYIHYMETGWKEGREGHSAIYDFNKYLAVNKDVKINGLGPIVHYITKGEKEGRRLFYVDQYLEKLNEKTANVVAGYIERTKYKKINDSAVVIVSLTTERALSNPKLINSNYDYISLGLPPQYTEVDSIWSYRPIRYHLNDIAKLKAFVTINLAQQLSDYRRVIWSVNESYLNSCEFHAALKQSESSNHKILVAGWVNKFTNDAQNIAIKRFLSSVGVEVGNNEQVALVEANFISYYMLSRKDIALLTKWWHFLAQNEIRNLIPVSLFESIGCQILIEKSYPDISKLVAIDQYLSEMAAYFSVRSKKRTCFDKSIACGESRVAVIVPVFNAIEDTKKCLRSVVESSYGNFHILIADDASEPDVQKWLQEFAEIHERVTLLKSKENSGYTINVNRAIRYCIDDDYIVLLNSDTIVYGDWIQKLIQRFSDDKSVGIVGPLSNKAGWQSCPNLRGENELPEGPGLEIINKMLEDGNHNLLCPEVDIVNGFCICISREVFDQVGLFDEESFPLGYGEEDDFCMRARLSGFKNVITLDTYVFHAKSKSMGHEKRLLLAKKGRDVLDSRYDKTHYQQITSSIGKNPILNTTRNDIAVGLAASFSVTSVIGEEVIHIKTKYSFDRGSQYKILIHFHCHYIGMCNYIAHYLRNLPFEYDLLITTSSDVEDKYFVDRLRSDKMSKIDIVRVENRGRDVYPFYYALKITNAAERYDFLLHVHTKKSAHDVLLGVNWISHMLAGTLHSNNYISNLLELMKRENIGLAFPRVLEQHHRSYQWGKNKSIAINLAMEAGINTANLDRPFSFPAGFMFWVQPKYLNKLACLELNDSSFPPEPIPIDGTLAHALERMLPHFVEADGGRVSPICVADSSPLDNELKFFSNNLLTADDVEAVIIDAIYRSKPLSLIRYFDGEGAFFKAKNWTDRYCKERMEYYFGSGDYSKQDAIHIRQTIMDSIDGCDIIGIPNIDIVKQVITFAGLYCDWDFEKLPNLKRRLNKHIDCSSAWRIISAFQFVCTSLSSESKYTIKDIHYDLVRSGGLYRIIDAANDVRLITSQPVSPLLSRIFGKKFICYDIPCRALDLEVSVSTKHYPSHNLFMRNKLQHIDFKGVVVLVGAGPLGKEYCSIVKNKGGIAIDIGAVFDSWINFLTRPEHSNGVGDIASDLLLTSENVTNLTQKAVRPKADVLVEDLPNAKRNPFVANVIN